MPNQPLHILLTYLPSKTQAIAMVEALLNEKLIACANIAPEVESHYAWQGQRCCERETPVWMKVDASALEAAKQRVRMLHPYDVPALLEWTASANPDYAEWVRATSLPVPLSSI